MKNHRTPGGGSLPSRRAVLASVPAVAIAAVACARTGTGSGASGVSTTAANSPATSGPAGTSTSNATTSSTASIATASSKVTASSTAPDRGGYVPPATGAWDTVDPEASGWSAQKLADLAAMVEAANSRTFVMLSGGRILAEHYWQGATAETVQDIASAQKSVVSTLIGIAREKRLLQLDDAVSKYLPAGWSKATPAQEAAITIRHLLTMTSGLDPRSLKQTSAPGTKFDYNTDAYQKLRPLLEVATKDGIDHLTRSWILDPIGADVSARWIERPTAERDATGAVPWGLVITARDMARFGLLAQRLGAWAESTIVSEGWLREAWTGSKTKQDYGYLWWLMGQGRLGERGAPADWVAALGAQDQKIYVIPSLDVVVARQGLAAKEVSETTSDFDAQLIRGIGAARL